jgi:predicted lipoprotein
MNKRLLSIAFLFMCGFVILYGCGKESTGSGDNSDTNKDFKIGMFTNYADNIIIPGYTDLQNKLDQLDAAINVFLTAPSDASQQSLKLVFKNTYISFEGISTAYFGPASSLLLNAYINSFPSATDKIETGIQNGVYNFSQPVASDSIQGFPALDYLLFSANAVQKFSDAGAANRKKYVQDVMARMKSLVSNTLTQWNNGYRTTFINSIQTNVGSSIGYLVNQFAFELDALKGPRIGWPFGKRSNGIVFADKCEAYYSGISKSLAIANLTSLKNYYTGANADGIADYLVKLGKSQLNGEVLTQFEMALNALAAIPDPMSGAFTNNATAVDKAYSEIQKLLTLMKTDVASATAVQVTYMDNDGD